MFNSGFGFKSELAILALLGFGIYAQNHEVNLANNTTVLLLLFAMFLGQEQIEDLRHDMYRYDIHRNHHNGFFNRFAGPADGFFDGRGRCNCC